MAAAAALAQAIDDALPQTQCTRCGYPDCRGYAQAIAAGEAGIDQCPPGGAEGVRRLAALTGRRATPLNPVHGTEAPRLLAVIDEAWCIGCTLCLDACPVDAIVGGPKAMHSVVDAQCTGCELCVPACPVDCIALTPVTAPLTGWRAWSVAQATDARERYRWHAERLARRQREEAARLSQRAPGAATEPDSALEPEPAPTDKRAVIAAALARARAARL
jgi:electron transport complex protein RnfB